MRHSHEVVEIPPRNSAVLLGGLQPDCWIEVAGGIIPGKKMKKGL